jgi:hypothetical protein
MRLACLPARPPSFPGWLADRGGGESRVDRAEQSSRDWLHQREGKDRQSLVGRKSSAAARVEMFHLHMTLWPARSVGTAPSSMPGDAGLGTGDTAESSRDGDATARGWARQAVGSGQRAAGGQQRARKEAYGVPGEGAPCRAPRHPGTPPSPLSPPRPRACCWRDDHDRGRIQCGVESASRRLPFSSKTTTHTHHPKTTRRARSWLGCVRLGADVVRQPRDCVEQRWHLPDLC